MLKTRIKTAVILAAIILPILLFSDVPYVLSGLTIVLNLCAVEELFRAARQKSLWKLPALVLTVALPLLDIPWYSALLGTAFPVIVLCFLTAMLRMDELSAPDPFMAFLLALTMTVFLSAIPRLREMEFGLYYLLLFMLICVATDSGAYFVGRARGRTKLAPSVSPHKTIEGALGGTVVAVVGSIAFCMIIDIAGFARVNYAALVLYAVCTSVVGQMGDLSMSLIKRLAGIKDFGNLLPGHGGILDRFDSMSFAAPFTMLFAARICGIFVM